ncbi:MAG: hypothetical protein JJ931_05320 [Henriciella sp.]|nr:hypothetical protein [Henriciella sp.]MBO6694820.1 hypothetical protein [Henriciella sp.]
MAQPSEPIVERRTGRLADDYGIETELSIEEKISRFEAAEYDLGFAEAALEKGHNRAEVFGDTKDIQDAIEVLKASAEYRAAELSEPEIKNAKSAGLLSNGLAEALADRKRATEAANTRLDDAAQRYTDVESLKEQERPDRDEEPER